MNETKENQARIYFSKYINMCEKQDPVEELESSLDVAVDLLKNLSNSESEVAYDKGKWTIKEVLSHIIDTERVFAYRALTFSRNDSNVLHSFDHDAYVAESSANDRALIDIVFEFMTVRNATISLFKSMDERMLERSGRWSDSNFTCLEISQIISGHCRHHINVIQEKYLK